MYVCIHAWIIVYTPHIRLYIHLYIVFTPRKLTRATTFKADQKTKTATGKHRAPRKSEKLRPRRFVRERVFYNNAHTGAFQLTHSLPPPLFYNSKVFTTTPFFYNNAHAGAMPSNALNPYLSPLALTPHPPQFQSFNPHPECGYLATLTHLIIPSTLTLFANGHGTLFC